MGLLATALLVANLALPPANVRESDNNVVSVQPTIYVLVSIDDQGKTYINTTPVDREQLLPAIMQLHTRAPKAVFLINPSDKAPLLDVGKITIMMQSEGVKTAFTAQSRGCPSPAAALDNIPNSNPKLNLGRASMPESLVISIGDRGKTDINESSTNPAELSLAIKQQHDQKPETVFLINAISKTRYGDATQAMGMMQSSGVKQIILNIALLNNQPSISLPINLVQIPSMPCRPPLVIP